MNLCSVLLLEMYVAGFSIQKLKSWNYSEFEVKGFKHPNLQLNNLELYSLSWFHVLGCILYFRSHAPVLALFLGSYFMLSSYEHGLKLHNIDN